MKRRNYDAGLLAIFLLAVIHLAEAQTLSEYTYNQINRAQELIADNRSQEAITRLEKLASRTKANGFEHAVVLQSLGYAYLGIDRYKSGAQALEKALDTNALPMDVTANIIYVLVQVHAGMDQHETALGYIKRWFKLSEDPANKLPDPKAEAYLLCANILAQLERYAEALPYAKQAIQRAEKPNKSWYQFLMALHYELEQYREVAGILETMIEYWPEDEALWRQLSSIYIALKEDKKALATLELAYQRGMLRDEKNLLNLARLSSYIGVPERGGRILKKSLEQGQVASNGKNWELLANLWTQAKEMDQAIEALKRAAELKADPKLYLRQVQLNYEHGNWQGTIEAARQAVRRNDKNVVGQSYLLMGLAYMELDQMETARKNLMKAQKYKKSSRQATQWINYIDQLRVYE